MLTGLKLSLKIQTIWLESYQQVAVFRISPKVHVGLNGREYIKNSKALNVLSFSFSISFFFFNFTLINKFLMLP